MRKFTYIYEYQDNEVWREYVTETSSFKLPLTFKKTLYKYYNQWFDEYEYLSTEMFFQCKMIKMIGNDIYYKLETIPYKEYFND